MAFDEVQFPPTISYGSSGGPGFSTAIITTDSGQEQRVARWANARRVFNVTEGVKSQADAYALMKFYLARLGPANGFRYKDWSDFSTASDGVSAPANTDETTILADDGTNQQLVKRYTSGGVTRVRKITKPVVGSVVFASGSGVVDFTTGIVTGLGSPVTFGCQFDVPVRFADSMDHSLPISLDDFGANSTKIELQEILNPGVAPSEVYAGGSSEQAPAANIALAPGTRLYILNPSADMKAVLPATTGLAPGGPYFFVIHGGASHTVTIADNGLATIQALTAGQGAEVYLTVDSVGTKVWYTR